jgi:tetratricopeptide (TPR) repeat protein
MALSLLIAVGAAHGAYMGMNGRSVPLESVGKPVGRAETAAESEYRLGVQELLRDNRSAARTRFNASLAADRSFVPALIGLASVAQLAGDLRMASEHLARAANTNPRSPALALATGRLRLAQGQWAEAETALKQAHVLAPQTLAPLLELGDLYLRRPDQTTQALAQFQAAAAVDARSPFVHYGLGVALAAAGRREEALAALATASHLAPRDPAPLRLIGRLHLEAGATDLALAALDQGLSRQPKALPLMLDRVDVLARDARWAQALEQAQAAQRLAANDIAVALKLGDVYQAMASWPQAESSYKRASALAPKNPVPYNNLAWITVARQGDAQQAVAWARKAVGLSPGSSPFHDTLGWALRAAGELPGAVAAVQQAVKLEPKVAIYHLHLAVLADAQGQAQAMRGALERALALDPSLRQHADARPLLAKAPGL